MLTMETVLSDDHRIGDRFDLISSVLMNFQLYFIFCLDCHTGKDAANNA